MERICTIHLPVAQSHVHQPAGWYFRLQRRDSGEWITGPVGTYSSRSAARRAALRHAATRCTCERVPVLCGCGWGSLGMPTSEIPCECPVCGFDFWEAFGVPDTCDHCAKGGN